MMAERRGEVPPFSKGVDPFKVRRMSSGVLPSPNQARRKGGTGDGTEYATVGEKVRWQAKQIGK